MLRRSLLALGIAFGLLGTTPAHSVVAAQDPSTGVFHRVDVVPGLRECSRPALTSVSDSGAVLGVSCGSGEGWALTKGIGHRFSAEIDGTTSTRVRELKVHDSGWAAGFVQANDGITRLVRWNPSRVAEVAEYSVGANASVLSVLVDGTVLLRYGKMDDARLLQWRAGGVVQAVSTAQNFRPNGSASGTGYVAGAVVEGTGVNARNQPAVWGVHNGVSRLKLGSYTSGWASCVSRNGKVTMGVGVTAAGDYVPVRYTPDESPFALLVGQNRFTPTSCNDTLTAVGPLQPKDGATKQVLGLYKSHRLRAVTSLLDSSHAQDEYQHVDAVIDAAQRVHTTQDLTDNVVTISPPAPTPVLLGTLNGATGNGCEGSGSFFVSWFNDDRLMRFYLNDNIARLGGQSRPSSSCTVRFAMSPPAGYRYALESSQHDGAAMLQPGDAASVSVRYQVGDSPFVTARADVPANPEFSVALQHGQQSPWSPCGVTSVFTVEVGRHLDRPGPSQADAWIGSSDKNQVTDALRFALQPC